MKHLRIFEEYNTSEFVKLFSHIKNFFNNMPRKYNLHIISDVSDYSFGVSKYMMRSFKLFKLFRILPLTDTDDEYFVLYEYGFDYYFDKNEIDVLNFIKYIMNNNKVDDVIPTIKIPDIISEINVDGFETYLNTKKYNL